jgi:hypothetical protein
LWQGDAVPTVAQLPTGKAPQRRWPTTRSGDALALLWGISAVNTWNARRAAVLSWLAWCRRSWALNIEDLDLAGHHAAVKTAMRGASLVLVLLAPESRATSGVKLSLTSAGRKGILYM